MLKQTYDTRVQMQKKCIIKPYINSFKRIENLTPHNCEYIIPFDGETEHETNIFAQMNH